MPRMGLSPLGQSRGQLPGASLTSLMQASQFKPLMFMPSEQSNPRYHDNAIAPTGRLQRIDTSSPTPST